MSDEVDTRAVIEGDLRQDQCDIWVYHGADWILVVRCVDEETAAAVMRSLTELL
jgi:hypothetical protein